ncbi:LysR family transcriptional regulator [Kineococcus terrestris]|uniref:LysR family transcriptional regulator n=1 Tax=Kineococcus terrestris TaxID=2044856 RepID=UPI0034DB0B6C
MDAQALRWFQLVADGVSVTDVSAGERVSQSGVSRALARLEAEVGTPLLRRSGRSLRPTRAGAAFKRHVDAALHALDDGLAAVEQVVDPGAGTVVLAFQASLGTWLVPDLLAGFRARHPRVGFELRPARDELTSSLTARGDVDVELTALRPVGSALRWRFLARQPLLLALPAGHRLARRDALALADVAGEPFLVLPPTSLLRRRTDELCAAAGLAPAVAFECGDLPSLRGFVAAGLGVAVVPDGPEQDPGVRTVPLTDAGAHRDVGAVWSPERRLLPAAERFLAHVTDRAGREGPRDLDPGGRRSPRSRGGDATER